MAISIEEALLAKAQQDQQNQMSTGTAALLGSGAGALAGATAGAVPYGLGQLKDRLMKGKDLVSGPMDSMRKAIKPGPRFAGGLVGAVLSGVLPVDQAPSFEAAPAHGLYARPLYACAK